MAVWRRCDVTNVQAPPPTVLIQSLLFKGQPAFLEQKAGLWLTVGHHPRPSRTRRLFVKDRRH